MWNAATLPNPSAIRLPRWTAPHARDIIPGGWLQSTLACVPFGATAQGGMAHFWEVDLVWLVLWAAVLAVLVTITFYVIGKIRPKSAQKERPANEWLAKYREMHSQGVLSDEEFRTIKTQLAQQLQDELNHNGKDS
jgi:uncharacterized membrane protein